MKDGVIWFGCFALLLVGMIFGINLDSNSTTLDSFYKVFGIIAGVGTLSTAVIASSALYTWKYQFSHSERFQAFKELEFVAFECIGEIERYWGVFKDEHFPTNTPCYYKDHTQAKSAYLDTFWKSKERYRVDVDFAQSLLTAKELKSFKYSYMHFDTKIHHILNTIVNSYDQLDGEERHQSHIKVEKDILDLKLEIKENMRIFRGR
ncbi:hypothetical protein [Shewanella colwelliana]|uniref:hypothetical protein n=1 Tax=Shewanella colwelliana TaxID=23 RepID=UPI003734E33A